MSINDGNRNEPQVRNFDLFATRIINTNTQVLIDINPSMTTM